MTAKQKKYLDTIRSFIEKHQRAPKLEEIGRMMGVSSSATVHNAVQRLIARGYLAKEPGKYGTLKIVPQKMGSMNSCNRQHPPIWYLAAHCPLCEVLDRQNSTGKTEAVALLGFGVRGVEEGRKA